MLKIWSLPPAPSQCWIAIHWIVEFPFPLSSPGASWSSLWIWQGSNSWLILCSEHWDYTLGNFRERRIFFSLLLLLLLIAAFLLVFFFCLFVCFRFNLCDVKPHPGAAAPGAEGSCAALWPCQWFPPLCSFFLVFVQLCVKSSACLAEEEPPLFLFLG